MTTPTPPLERGGWWWTSGVLFCAALSLALIVDQALIVAAGRHLTARVDGWLAGLQPDPEPEPARHRGPLVDVDKLRQAVADTGAAPDGPSETDQETPGT